MGEKIRNRKSDHPPRTTILKKLVLQEGQSGNLPIAILPSLQRIGVINGACIGPNWQNMAEGYEPQNIAGVRSRMQEFLDSIGAGNLKDAFLMTKINRDESPIPIADITHDMVVAAGQRSQQREDIETVLRKTEAMITTEEGIPLMMKIADCFGAVVYGKKEGKKPFLAVLHLSRDMVDRQLIKLVTDHLKNDLGYSMADVQVGIFPGMGYPNNTIRTADKDALLTDGAWPSEFMETDGEFIYLDPLRYAIEQFTKAGVPNNKIEAYGDSEKTDTYDMAQMEPPQAASYRYATRRFREGGPDERKARNLVVAQLPKTA